MEDISKMTLVATQAALKAGATLKRGFRTNFEISSKEGKHNLVTEYDHLAEKLIISYIKEHFDDHSFLAEESGETKGEEEIQWVIDPLDGTVNFAHGIPMFAVSIAACQGGDPLCGVIYQPITQELFIAEKGGGAYLNGSPIKVTETEQLDDAFVALGFPYNLSENPGQTIDHFIDVLKLGLPIRRIGVAALDLAYVASCRFDFFFEVALGPWDCAAGILLVNEAGGKVTSWNGKPFNIYSGKPILASNGLIHSEISSILGRRI